MRSFLDARQGFDTATWKVMTDQVGIAALAIPEEYGARASASANWQW